jgi:dephospho-CoA kinase
MIALGLTGGIGMGKSTVAALLEQQNFAVVDTDELARQVVEPGQPALEEIRSAFGAGVVGPEGRLRREVLAETVFADPAQRHRLEAIVHPRIRERWQARLAAWEAAGVARAAVVIPLLFEIGAESEFGITVCVACSPAAQRQRLLARGWTEAQIARRNQAQLPVENKLARSNYVLWNEGERSVLAGQLARVLRGLSCGSCSDGDR